MALQVNSKIGVPQITFDPTSYRRAYSQYRQGIYRDLIEMMNRAEIDSHVSGCLIGRRAGFQRDFSVMPFESDNDQDKERADQFKTVLLNLDHRTLFADIQEARLKKFSVIDFEWEVEEILGAQLQVPVSHRQLEHKYFRYDTKDKRLKIDFGKELREIDRSEALVIETAEMPILLPVLRDYILKEFGLESWAGFIEAFGEPIVLGKFPAGASKETKEALQAAVDAVARSSRGIMPQDAELEIKETQRTTGDHEKFVTTADAGIAISLLGHKNSVEQGSGLQVGENLGQYKVKMQIAVDDMFFIEQGIRQLVRIFWQRNYGDQRYPSLNFDKKEPLTWRDKLDLVNQAYQHGLTINPDEYRDLGLRVYDDQQPLVKTSPF